MFTAAQQHNVMLPRLLRIAGFVLMSAGPGMLLRPLPVIADYRQAR
jgi:hypothetical protein